MEFCKFRKYSEADVPVRRDLEKNKAREGIGRL